MFVDWFSVGFLENQVLVGDNLGLEPWIGVVQLDSLDLNLCMNRHCLHHQAMFDASVYPLVVYLFPCSFQIQRTSQPSQIELLFVHHV